MTPPITAIRRVIYGALSGAGLTLGTPAAGYAQNIYDDIAPPDAGYPYVLIGKSSGIPIAEGFGSPTVALESDLWMVKAVDHNTTADPAEALASRILSLLNDKSLTPATGTTIQLLRRESDIRFTEMDSGEVYHHVGSLYRVEFAYTTSVL